MNKTLLEYNDILQIRATAELNMRTIKFSLIILSLGIYLIIGAILHLLLFWADSYVRIKLMNRMTVVLMRFFLAVGNLKAVLKGDTDILKENGLFFVSTHIGYLDGIILGTLIPGSFTTKASVKKTPLLGKVVSMGNSIFIDRRKKRHINQYVNLMADRLRHGINVFNFPEGFANDGTQVLPFFSAFFDAPLKAKAPVVPITIDYQKVNGSTTFDKDDVYCYGGKVSIIKHLWKHLLCLNSIDVVVTVHDKIDTENFEDNSKGRKELSDFCRKSLSLWNKIPLAQNDSSPVNFTPKMIQDPV